jgi:hypothetical protein
MNSKQIRTTEDINTTSKKKKQTNKQTQHLKLNTTPKTQHNTEQAGVAVTL